MSTLTVGTIAEKVTDAGVAVDGVTLKDGGATFTSAVGVTGNTTITSGNLVIGTSGNGIDFSAVSGSASGSSSALLDDYEEGTWTPSWGVASGSIGTFSTLASGRYTKVGRLVHIQGYISYGSNSSASGAVSVHGLPFTSTSSGFGQSDNQSGGITCVANTLWSSDCPEAGRIPASSTNFTPVISTATGTTQIEFADFSTGANHSQLVFFGTYIVNT